MSKLKFCDYEILSADLGEENLMPDIKNIEYIHAGFTLSEKVREEDKKYFGKGMIKTILPYGIQDNYNRERKPRKFKAAILENENLKAVFLPEVGGRLWSLYHKKLKRELLYVNPVFQPGNLAIRNAWFSGGVEWNIGIKGHNPLTCSPMYAAEVTDDSGNTVLRMYEYERIRGLSYYMDFLLPEGSEVLYVKTTVENTSDEDKYMYWWSNIAVPETKGTRVVAPSNEAFVSSYGENKYYVDMIGVPVPEGTDIDITYSTNVNRSQDYFFRIDKDKRKWITAIEEDGIGLIQFSTPELIGRKIFVWGQGQGGKNWSNWLSGKPNPYIEIQAGLARTQLEHITMKKNSTLSWVEGYAAAKISPAQVHGDYKTAVDAVENYIDNIKPSDNLMFEKFENFKKCEVVQNGSGWGYIENLIRKKENKSPVSNTVCYPETALKNEEKIWVDFINNGYMREESLEYPPLSYHVSEFWKDLYEKQIKENKVNAYMYLQYGVNKYANGDIDGAYECFLNSCELKPNPWGFRNLSMIEKNEYKNFEKAVEFIEKAISLNLSYRGLIVNCAQVMLGAGKYERWLEIFDGLFEPLKKDGRLLIYKAIALMNLKRYHEATEIINTNFVLSDIKEGEVSVSHIWFELYSEIVAEKYNITDKAEIERIRETEYPLPGHLDFRME